MTLFYIFRLEEEKELVGFILFGQKSDTEELGVKLEESPESLILLRIQVSFYLLNLSAAIPKMTPNTV